MFAIRVKGNIESLKTSTLVELEELYDFKSDREEFVSLELTEKLAELTERINREIAVYLDRKGKVLEVSVGDSRTAPLPLVDGRRDRARLSGIRCIHTHPGGSGILSSVDVSSLLTLRLDAMAAIGVLEGKPVEIYAAVPSRNDEGEFEQAAVYGPFKAGDRRMKGIMEVVRELEKNSPVLLHSNEGEVERAILVALEPGGKVINGKTEGERLLEELEELASTAGAEIVGKVLQRKQSADPAYHIGKGKLEELNLMRQSAKANLIIFDDELSGAQVRNIEELVGTKVIDRTTLILDIFAKRAHSREGKIQVELAQMKYRLPRLMGMGTQLSRLGGGIGTRGPGEKKLEVDRRHIRRRISILEEELKEVTKRRGLMREGRRDAPQVAVVGYTNAGKSTLMNALCSSEVLVEDKLFATLDPTTRSFSLPDGRQALLVDTVGFIRKLPHDLVEAFKSTLEEAVYADVLLHVVDMSSEEMEVHIEVVNELLRSLGAIDKPIVLVLNKVDLVNSETRIPVLNPYGPICEISAARGQGLEELLEAIARVLPKDQVKLSLLVPYDAGWVIPYLHQNGKLLEEEFTEEGILVKAEIKKDKVGRVEGFVKG